MSIKDKMPESPLYPIKKCRIKIIISYVVFTADLVSIEGSANVIPHLVLLSPLTSHSREEHFDRSMAGTSAEVALHMHKYSAEMLE